VCGLQAEGTRYYAMASLRSGAGIAGAARLLGSGDAAALGAAAQAGPPGSNGLRYHPPYRTPRGTLEGLRDDQGPGDLARSFLEGWSFAVRFLTEELEAFSGRSFARLTVCGGGGRLSLALDIQAAVLNRPLKVAAVSEAAALGACLLAAKAAGLELRPAVGDSGERVVIPRPDWARLYDGIYRREYLGRFRTGGPTGPYPFSPLDGETGE